MLIEAERFTYDVTLRGERFEVQVEDERTRRLNMGRKMVSVPEGELADFGADSGFGGAGLGRGRAGGER